MKNLYLVASTGKNMFMVPYSEQYKVFESPEGAIEYAQSVGYERNFLGLNLSSGIKNMYSCGEVEIFIMTIEVNP